MFTKSAFFRFVFSTRSWSMWVISGPSLFPFLSSSSRTSESSPSRRRSRKVAGQLVLSRESFATFAAGVLLQIPISAEPAALAAHAKDSGSPAKLPSRRRSVYCGSSLHSFTLSKYLPSFCLDDLMNEQLFPGISLLCAVIAASALMVSLLFFNLHCDSSSSIWSTCLLVSIDRSHPFCV